MLNTYQKQQILIVKNFIVYTTVVRARMISIALLSPITPIKPQKSIVKQGTINLKPWKPQKSIVKVLRPSLRQIDRYCLLALGQQFHKCPYKRAPKISPVSPVDFSRPWTLSLELSIELFNWTFSCDRFHICCLISRFKDMKFKTFFKTNEVLYHPGKCSLLKSNLKI